jgi:hypothetical protein
VRVHAAIRHSVVFLGIGIRGSRAVDVQSLRVEAACVRDVKESCAVGYITSHHTSRKQTNCRTLLPRTAGSSCCESRRRIVLELALESPPLGTHLPTPAPLRLPPDFLCPHYPSAL